MMKRAGALTTNENLVPSMNAIAKMRITHGQ